MDSYICFAFNVYYLLLISSYIPVRLLEICLPAPKILIRNQGPSKTILQQDLKDFALK